LAKALEIAVIDDDESFRVALVESLLSLGFGVWGYSSAEDFLAAGSAAPSDLVVSDIHMPGMSGLDLMQHLAARSASLPFILITARSEPNLEAKAAAVGAVCLLRKPFETADLVECVERAVKKPPRPIP
jgi:FixJ family two-component response regulator